MQDSFTVRPIGVVRSPFSQKVEAPRQARGADGVEARIELDRAWLHAVEDLDGFEHVWVLAWMDRVEGFRPKVLPPRSAKRRGVFATRSPHRPNPIALSVTELLRVEGTVLHVRGLDLLDGTPVLDIKPYVPWADAIPRSRVGWLEEDNDDCSARHVARDVARNLARNGDERPRDPRGAYEVALSPRAAAQLAWLDERGVSIEPTLRTILETSPLPHPYRRIRPADETGTSFVLALSEWRVAFRLDAADPKRVHVVEVRTGYRPRELDGHPLHRALTDGAFPARS